MADARNMALWLVAVIVLIAGLAMPSGAQAHTGHAHAGSERAVASVTPLPASVAATSVATATKSVTAAAVIGTRLETGLARACDGACCRTPGTPCCTGTALAPDTQAAPNGRRPAERALARALPARTDVVPEALPEPPRSFA